MPYAPATCCPCGGRKTNGRCDRCDRGKRARDTRKSAAERGYDWTWQKFRKVYLSEHPLCSDCEAEGRVGAATDIHHKQKLRDRPELKYEEENLMALCKACHDKRTARGE
jgi:5-methylcytosine-specific restriction protein A